MLAALAVTPVLAESSSNTMDGADGQDITGTGPSDSSLGGRGQSDYDSGYAGNGGDGGDVTSVVSQSGSNGVSATSQGGDGGNGYGFIEEWEGQAGSGGNGGKVDLTLTGTSDGNLTATSQGGDAGWSMNNHYSQATGGTGGEVVVTVATTGVVTGDLIAQSVSGTSMDNVSFSQSTEPQGGDVTVTIAGTVQGNVDTSTNGGTINVVLDGGVVTGVISAYSRAENALTFSFDVADNDEFKAATATLTGQEASGQVKINGHTYSWEGFSTLVDLLRYTGPKDKVVVSVDKETTNHTTTVGDPVFTQTANQRKPEVKPEAPRQVPKLVGDIPLVVGKPEMARCSGGSEIRTVRLDDGSMVVIHRTGGADALIGKLEDGEFHRSSDAPDWTIRVADEGKSVQVSDATGNALSNCSFS
jgi:hypothetical protein